MKMNVCGYDPTKLDLDIVDKIVNGDYLMEINFRVD